MGLFNFNKKTTNDYTDKVELIGIYNIDNEDDVKLVELRINADINSFDAGLITQEIKGTDRLNWQTAYDEKYIDLEGKRIIGDDLERPKDLKTFQIVFFFYYLDLSKPLISQYGLTKLTDFEKMPDRLSNLINYEPVD
jgi:hypothetical protein